MDGSPKLVCVGLMGTLLDHRDGHLVPLMLELLQSLMRDGWEVVILTSFPVDTARKLLAAKLELHIVSGVEIESSSDKAVSIRNMLERRNPERMLVIDDKPAYIKGVASLHDDRVWVIGFLGSGKYTPEAARVCDDLGVAYALTAVDLAGMIPVSLNRGDGIIKRLSTKDLIDLIPGLHHPCSAVAGETWVFDDRTIVAAFESRYEEMSQNTEQHRLMWMNLAWIRCDECAWKWMLLLACRGVGFDFGELGGLSAKVNELNDNLLKKPQGIVVSIVRRLDRGLTLMREGVERCGGKATECRYGVKMAEDRLRRVEERLRELCAS